MKTPNDYDVDTVYSYQSPKDLQRYYNDWAQEYDNYTKDVKYILPDQVAKIFFDTIFGISIKNYSYGKIFKRNGNGNGNDNDYLIFNF